jgi:hypothetical protein
MRRVMRESESIRRGKVENYRKCYIGLKVTSVPCHTDGSIRSSYVPRTEHHPFDTTFPQAGDNFFEDMVVNPEEGPEPDSEETIDAVPSSEAGDSPANLGEDGANYLEYTRRLAQDEPVARTTHTPRLKLKLKLHGLEAAPKTAAPEAATRRAVAPKTTTPTLRTHPTTAAPTTQNAKSTTPVVSPQRARKRPMFESEDDYEETEEEDEERPAKRRISTTRAVKTATPKTTSAKPNAKTASANAKKTATPARRTSTRGRKSG